MKQKTNRWGGILSPAEGLPLIRHLSDNPRRGAAAGVWIGAILILIFGAVLGGINRGSSGILIAGISGGFLGAIIGGALGALIGAVRTAPQARATLRIELERHNRHFRPGDTVNGAVELYAENSFRANGGKVYFACRGFYAHNQLREGASEPEFVRESRQYLLQQQDTIPTGTVRQGSRYACSVRWTLNALLDAPAETPIEVREEIYVESLPEAVATSYGGYQSAAADHGELVLTLPRVVFAEGKTIRGHIQVSPSETFEAEEVRALLLRIENTPKGDNHTVYVGQCDPTTGQFQGERRPGGQGSTYIWLEDETVIGSPVHFGIAEPRSWFFQLNVPTQWRPTFATKDGKVTWKVGVIVMSRDLPDLRAFHEVLVHTAPIELPEAAIDGEAET